MEQQWRPWQSGGAPSLNMENSTFPEADLSPVLFSFATEIPSDPGESSLQAVKAVGDPIKLNWAPKCESDLCNVFTLGLYVYILKFEAKMQLFQAELHTAHCAVSDLAEAGRASGKPQKVAKECLQGFSEKAFCFYQGCLAQHPEPLESR